MKYKAIPLLLCPVLAYGKSITHISTYEDNYVLGTYTTDINQDAYNELGSDMDSLQQFEVKFQISASIPFYRFSSGTALMGSYTQKSLWQLANSDISSPFRETNYKPQVFLAHQSNMRGGTVKMADRMSFRNVPIRNVTSQTRLIRLGYPKLRERYFNVFLIDQYKQIQDSYLAQKRSNCLRNVHEIGMIEKVTSGAH